MAKKILKGVGSVAKFAAGGILGNAIFGGKKKPAATIAPTAERVMPIADDEAVKRAQKLSMIRQRSRSGRSSTILSGSGDTLGG